MNAPDSAVDLYNATLRVVRRRSDAMVVRVAPDGPVTRYLGGQYGSLGLASASEPGKLIKRAYSLSSPIVDVASGRLVDHGEADYYEFYFNLVESASDKRERLTPKLFALPDESRVFCGQKIIGHYTSERVPEGKNVLLVATTTGEAANNSIVNDLLRSGRAGKICSVLLGARPWESLYAAEQEALAKTRDDYRCLKLDGDPLPSAEALITDCLSDKTRSRERLGFELDPSSCHLLLCGDPDMIGAPRKMGGWNYEQRETGLLRLLSAHGFSAGSRFKQGEIDHEAYW